MCSPPQIDAMTSSPLFDAAQIAQRIPHQGRMCLLDALWQWDAHSAHCSAHSHLDPLNPLRLAGELPAPVAIEYAAQAMALHGSVCAPDGTPPTPGFLAAARDVVAHVPRLDTVHGALHVRVRLHAGDARQALYRFELHDADGRPLVSGRATVVLNTPLTGRP